MFGFILGTGSYDQAGFQKQTISTQYGDIDIWLGEMNNTPVAILCRHGEGHKYLPNHINFRANISALHKVGATKIIAFSVAGVLDPTKQLAKPSVITDLYYPENRLPNGEICTFYDTPNQPGRGHLIAESLFHGDINNDIIRIFPDGQIDTSGTYVYSIGPRFNTKSEIKGFQNVGGDFVSQTCGAEAVLAGELEIPFAQVCFGVDYANGVQNTPTPIEELEKNISQSTHIFQKIMEGLVSENSEYLFQGFVYRF